MIGDISKIDITNLNFSQNEVGDFIKSSKVLYTWEFILEKNYRHKIELQHQRIKGNRIVMIDGQEVSNNSKYTYNYSYSFPLNKHYFTIIQIAPDQYDLRIDNISFTALQNRIKYGRVIVNNKKEKDWGENEKNKKKEKNIKDDDNFFKEEDNNVNFDNKFFNNNEDAFDFDENDNKNTKKDNKTQKETNLIDLGFEDKNQNSNTNNSNSNNNLSEFDFFANSNTNNNNNNVELNNNNPIDLFDITNKEQKDKANNLIEALNSLNTQQSNNNDIYQNNNINNNKNNDNNNNNNLFNIDLSQNNNKNIKDGNDFNFNF